jgi:acyl-CoA hydrolase/GNAT superfamily N-acetyltransferase
VSISNWRQHYEKRVVDARSAISNIKPGHRIVIGSACGAPQALIRELAVWPPTLSDIEIVHLLTFGDAPYVDPKFDGIFRHNAFFIGDNVRDAVSAGRADYTPIMLSEIPNLFKTKRLSLDTALITVTPPDEFGYCSLGISVDLTKSAAENANLVIAQVNPHMPRVLGNSFIHVEEIDFFVEHAEPIVEYTYEPQGEVADKIGYHVSKLVEDGATIQIGIGGIPNSLCRYLTRKKHLGVHSEVISDGLIDLIREGVVDCSRKSIHPNKVVATFAMGGTSMYRFLNNNPIFEFHPTEYANSPLTIARNHKMTAINSALTVDLTGQVNSDSLGYRFYSGIGGQADFMRGAALAPEGRPIIALPSVTPGGRYTRIVPHLAEGAGVVITRGDVHYVVTEWGIAYLHGKTIRERTLALISIAHPNFREALLAAAKKNNYLFQDQMLPERAYPIELETTFQLKNGESVFIRPVIASDEDQLREMFYDLSSESRLFRFFSPLRDLPHRKAQPMVNVDYENQMALVALQGWPREEAIVSVAAYFVDKETNSASVAFMTRDDYQNQGLGTFMLQSLIKLAIAGGIRKITAEVLPGNLPMLHVFRKTAANMRVTSEGNILRITFDI